MKKILAAILSVSCCLGAAAYCLTLGYDYFTRTEALDKDGKNNSGTGGFSENFSSAVQAGAAAVTPQKPVKSEPDEPQNADDPRIEPSTKMVYEYYYTMDNVIEKTEELPPYFLMGLTKERLAEMFTGWDVINFSAEEVVMRKYLNERSVQHYIVGVKDGYVAVFYENDINGGNLKEMTNTPVKTLSEAEQNRLKKGIVVEGEPSLIRVLQDYGS